MKPFCAPTADILFSLEHLAGVNALADWDGELAKEITGHFATLAESEIAPLDEVGDRQGCQLTAGRVTMPDGFAEAYKIYSDQGWPGLTAPEEFGGQGMNSTILAATSEIFSGACHSLQMVAGLVPGAIRTLIQFGTDDQKARLIPPLASGKTLATMCLTEPAAGSDLSKVRCRAVFTGETWHIAGEKIFISGGDQDISDEILHLVLARTSDDGVLGLSLFLCPSKTDGGRNRISVTRIEEKMGLHASPTCQLAFDGATAELIGREGEGLRAMFTMMNHARLDVSLQGVAHAARSFDVAQSYAAERVQGRRKDGSPAVLDQHADVARILAEIDALAIGGRAIAHIAAVTLEAGDNRDLVEFLTPIAKVYCTEAGMKAAEMGMQVLGGYGYLSEYRLEQTYRDARITAIYEGANGIHERALSERFSQGRNAKSADAFDALIAAEANTSGLKETLTIWREVRQMVANASNADALAHEFMKVTADTLLHLIWARSTDTAAHHPDPDRIRHLAKTQILRIQSFLPARQALIEATAKRA
jgi:alkylation response protein AidB-like acyl-CoA dehydrogenase